MKAVGEISQYLQTYLQKFSMDEVEIKIGLRHLQLYQL